MELIQGDCLEVMKDLSDNIAQVFFCDLPYGEIRCKWDSPIDLSAFWSEALRIGKDNCVYCFTATMKFAHTLISSNPKMFKYELVLVKRQPSNPMVSTHRHMPQHELGLVFYKKTPKWNKDKYHTRVMAQPSYTTSSALDNTFNQTSAFDKSKLGKCWEPKLPVSILEMNSRKMGKSIHPTRKPVDLIVNLLKYWTDPGDLVIDPTAGSGATGEACKELGLRFIGIEKHDKWFDVMKARLLPGEE